MIICMLYEHAVAGIGEWFSGFCEFVVKGCIEGLIVLGILRLVVVVYRKRYRDDKAKDGYVYQD